MMETQLVPPLQVQDQTGYAKRFRRPQAVVLTVTPAVADDTGLEGDFVLDPAGASWRPAPSIEVLGERFDVGVDDELGVVISHRKWSLMGFGGSLGEAEKMLMDYAGDLAESIVDDSPLEYTEEGNRLREFVLRFLYLSVS